MSKIIQISTKTLSEEVTVIFDLEKLELVERRDNKVYIFVGGKISIIDCSDIPEAILVCSKIYNKMQEK